MSFDGFVEMDFSRDVTGTTWRGRLSEDIRDCLSDEMKVYSVYPEARIFIRREGLDDMYQAKLFVAASEGGLRCGYYLERPLSGEAALQVEPGRRLTQNADWFRFLSGLKSGAPRADLARLGARFPDIHLSLRSEGESLSPIENSGPLNAEQLQRDEVLDSLYEYVARWDGQRWLDIYIERAWDKEEALQAGPGIVEPICETLNACLPLYDHTAGKPEGVQSSFVIEEQVFVEGAERVVVQTQRERDSKLREAVIERFGRDCMVCGFNFDDFYGEHLADGYIEVHHLKPISAMNGEEEVRSEDCIVVCSNCHRIIHRGPEIMDWNELRERIFGS